MQARFLSIAQKELLDSMAYYEQMDPGLGIKFMEEVEETVAFIMQYPQSGMLLNAYARRVLLNRFPFGVVYRLRGSELVILSVMHLKREPNFWIKRT
ncbi:MAG: type II toxin-antitoxin system RelE/ParE family toxin [Balneolales bacterium]|nr:type II toxin-antitoxin system RelE/ParE family toxin [Balneolales bacterium]